ncbi:hypothetical protein ACFOWZ_23515 [Lentzea rhizosphaerae]|uniref:Uncharacterized protein n=1 Tax=Lentzea rhizosphaerae TaxID=2041025 RepID=A0ABV8BXL1_9PSEU
MISENDLKKILAAVVAGYVSSATRRWARQRGLDRRVATLLSTVAGAVASAVVLRT